MDALTSQAGCVLDVLTDGMTYRYRPDDTETNRLEVASGDRGSKWVLETERFLVFTSVNVQQKGGGLREPDVFETITVKGDIAYTAPGEGENAIREARVGALAILADLEAYIAEDFALDGQAGALRYQLSNFDIDSAPSPGTSGGHFCEITFEVIVQTHIKPA